MISIGGSYLSNFFILFFFSESDFDKWMINKEVNN